MPKLIILNGSQKGSTFELPRERITIGRDYSNEVQIQGQKISRTHAMIEPSEDGWQLTDLGSRNGSMVNDKPVKAHVLKPRDEIGIGEITLLYVSDEAPPVQELVSEETLPQEILTETFVGQNTAWFAAQEQQSTTDIQQLNSQLRALLELSRDVGTARSLPELLDGLSRAVDACLEPDRIVPIVIRDDNSLHHYSVTQSDFHEGLADLPISTSIVKHAREKKVAVLSKNPVKDKRFAQAKSISKNEIATAMCAPVIREEEMLGLLYVDRLGEAESFNRDELEMLGAIGMCMASPLANISYFDIVNREKQALEKEVKSQFHLLGKSQAMESVYNFIEKSSMSDACVLITGESGTGKELVARAIHYNSVRKGRALEIVNCAGLNHTLMDNELFGHCKGAFTDARDDKPGRFELADKGTIFLDEMGELSDACQSKLLRVLEHGELRRLGDTHDRHVDIRIVAATNRDLRKAIEENNFREDLFYRLNILSINLPTLRERPGDIELLLEHFLKEFGSKCAKPELKLSPAARDILLSHRWPGNVRELKNTIERMIVMSSGAELGPEDIPAEIKGNESPATRAIETVEGEVSSLADMEKQHIFRVLQHTGGNKKETARVLGIDRSTLYARLKTYNIDA